MPLTPEQIAKIRQKEADLPDALKRDSLTDYFEGFFFVTLNTRGEAPILSEVKGVINGAGENAPHCEYKELGEKVMKCWNQIPKFYPNVTIIDAEVMPEHFHGLLHIDKKEGKHLGKVINGFMIGCTHGYWDELGIEWRNMKSTEDSGNNSVHTGAIAHNIGRKGKNDPQWQDNDHTRSLRGPALFLRGYNDVEPITSEEVQIKIDYIRNQAKKRLIQGERYDCFRITRNAHSKNWTVNRALDAIAADPHFAHFENDRKEAIRNVFSKLNMDENGICLDYLGNREWMASEKKLPLICHRADVNRFAEQMTSVLDAARNGYIIVSAFISKKERDIKTQLMIEQLPFIEIMDNGFSERYKPIGKAFYACGENRLVQITCWKYLYQKNIIVSREMCLVMNELARVISGVNDDWWKR